MEKRNANCGKNTQILIKQDMKKKKKKVGLELLLRELKTRNYTNFLLRNNLGTPQFKFLPELLHCLELSEKCFEEVSLKFGYDMFSHFKVTKF